MRVNRCGDDDSIYFNVIDDVAVICSGLNVGIASLYDCKSFRNAVTDGDDARVGNLAEIANNVRPPIAITDNADADRRFRNFSYFPLSRMSPTVLAGTPATIA